MISLPLLWKPVAFGLETESVPWNTGHSVVNVRFWLERRPSYCDRGRWIAKTDAPLDDQEGWPRYYFELESAMSELNKWMLGREELK